MNSSGQLGGFPAISHRKLAGVVAGCVGGTAFAATMLADIAITGRRVNDFQLLGGIGPTASKWRVTGPLIHIGASAILGAMYTLCEPVLRGPGWMRGISFALIENTLLWPAIIMVDRYHPAINKGELPPFNEPWPFVAENLRHAAYGLALGLTFERITRRR